MYFQKDILFSVKPIDVDVKNRRGLYENEICILLSINYCEGITFIVSLRMATSRVKWSFSFSNNSTCCCSSMFGPRIRILSSSSSWRTNIDCFWKANSHGKFNACEVKWNFKKGMKPQLWSERTDVRIRILFESPNPGDNFSRDRYYHLCLRNHSTVKYFEIILIKRNDESWNLGNKIGKIPIADIRIRPVQMIFTFSKYTRFQSYTLLWVQNNRNTRTPY